MAKEGKACNVLLLKINQIDSITEVVEEAKQAYSYGWSVRVSHRSSETADDSVISLRKGSILDIWGRGVRVAEKGRQGIIA
ncbi:hypothetical protein LTS18_010432 [Coniosporium uncinatum]|uniref:Uncharacterized protein n=1 Tax=Coniosporium uncinatum TaxID=93489 RepID=A0ACC3D9U5_9PEZI|nr:hypothetical protein LTS18_010432 [Coniosporium uncinatum]